MQLSRRRDTHQSLALVLNLTLYYLLYSIRLLHCITSFYFIFSATCRSLLGYLATQPPHSRDMTWRRSSGWIYTLCLTACILGWPAVFGYLFLVVGHFHDHRLSYFIVKSVWPRLAGLLAAWLHRAWQQAFLGWPHLFQSLIFCVSVRGPLGYQGNWEAGFSKYWSGRIKSNWPTVLCLGKSGQVRVLFIYFFCSTVRQCAFSKSGFHFFEAFPRECLVRKLNKIPYEQYIHHICAELLSSRKSLGLEPMRSSSFTSIVSLFLPLHLLHRVQSSWRLTPRTTILGATALITHG